MAVLDRFVEALLKTPGAQSMKLVSGFPTELVVDGAPRPVSRSVPTVEQIFAALGEVLPESFLAELRIMPSEATYASPHGPVRVRARFANEVLTVWLMPGTAPASPPRPASEEATRPLIPRAATSLEGHLARVPLARVEVPTPTATIQEVDVRARPPITRGDVGHLEELFHAMLDAKASDLHLKSGAQPFVRVDGDMRPLGGFPELSKEKLEKLIAEILPERNRAELHELKDTDFAHQVPARARMRCNVFEDIDGIGAVFRQIPSRILTAKELGLPPAVLKLCEHPKGLVLVTGPTGSGKSTTLAAMIDHINSTTTDHIITIEDPVEFVHQSKGCLINQREVGSNTRSFKNALRAALREDPDVVLVGELRDLETTAIAIETAETGHLVFGTMHTTTAPATVDRVVNQFPADRRAPIRAMLSESLIGVVSQMLCKKRGGGRIAAMEVLIVNSAVANLIREEKTFQIVSIMQTSKALGMQTLNESLLALVRNQLVEPDEAFAQAVAKRELAVMLGRAGFKGAFSEESG